MHYAWRDQSFEVPDRLTDRSIVMLTDERSPDESLAIAFAVDQLQSASPGALESYVDDVLREAAARLHRLLPHKRELRRVHERDAVVVVHTASTGQHDAVMQHQAFVRRGHEVTIVTVSCSPQRAATGERALSGVLNSMRVLAPNDVDGSRRSDSA